MHNAQIFQLHFLHFQAQKQKLQISGHKNQRKNMGVGGPIFPPQASPNQDKWDFCWLA